jgi:uncharacterized protein YcbK (DUF882 family)
MLLQRLLSGFAASIILVFGCPCFGTSAHADRQHTVKPGQSLIQIAKQYGVPVAAIAKANKLGPDDTLQIGQRLTLPTTKPTKDSKVAAAEPRAKSQSKTNGGSDSKSAKGGAKARAKNKDDSPWGSPKRPGTVTFYRIWSRETVRVKLVDDRGAARSAAQRAMRELMRPRESRKRKLPNGRLLQMLANVSDHFGGRPLHIVSGYRLPGGLTRDTSRHVAGEAMDFRIPGVSLTELRDYCHRFHAAGVGYYPRTHFVHLDARRQNARWTDWSLPGQPAVLTKPDDVDDLGNPVEAEPIMAASDEEMQEAPPAPDDGLPPLEDVPVPRAFGSSAPSATSRSLKHDARVLH